MNLSGLARKLVQEEILSEQDAVSAQESAQKAKQSFVSYLVSKGLADSARIALIASREFGIPVFDLDSFDAENIPADLMDEDLVRKNHALPLMRHGNRVFVAISDPMNLGALDDFKFKSGHPTDAVLVEEDKLSKLIDAALSGTETGLEDLDLDEDLDNLETTSEDEQAGADVTEADIDDTPVVRFVNKVLLDAINKKASDIHLEPYEKKFRVRFRIDGVLHEVASPPTSTSSATRKNRRSSIFRP